MYTDTESTFCVPSYPYFYVPIPGIESNNTTQTHHLGEISQEMSTMQHSSFNDQLPKMEIFHCLPKDIQQNLKKLLTQPEILTRLNQSEWQQSFGYVARYRHRLTESLATCTVPDFVSLVNSWIDYLDNFMEENHVLLIYGVIPNRWQVDLIPRSVSHVTIWPNTFAVVNGQPVIHLPTFLTGPDNQRNPFVGKSLVLTCFHRDSVYDGISHTINMLFARFAHHLSVLCLTNMSLDLDNFRFILKASENLKVLILNNFKLGVKDQLELRFPQLPVLSKLKTLIVLNYFCVYRYYIFANLVQQQHLTLLPIQEYDFWIFNGYTKDLIKLDFRYYKALQIEPFSSLKQLSIVATCLSFFENICIPHTLEYISISSLGESGRNYITYDVNVLFGFLGPCSSKLREVYLDIDCSEFFGKNELTSQLQRQEYHSFHNVKKLTLPFPKNEQKMQMYMGLFFTRFTMLQELVFLSYSKGWYPCPFYYSGVNYPFPTPQYFEPVWHLCVNLKTITILRRDGTHKTYTYSQSALERPEGI